MDRRIGLAAGLLGLLVACGGDGAPDAAGRDAGPGITETDGGRIRCTSEEATACFGNVFYRCERNGEFFSAVPEDCEPADLVCVNPLGCVTCRPGDIACIGYDAVGRCRDDGQGYDPVEMCDVASGDVCFEGECRQLCEVAVETRSYVGCEFYGVDLDNAALGAGLDASSQPYAIVVSNPGGLESEVIVEQNDAPFGSAPQLLEVERTILPPGDLEVFNLPRREVDGSSSRRQCTADGPACPGSEVCVCTSLPCECLNSIDSTRLNDGTHTAATSHAYRVRSQFPIIAYQFNPLDNVDVFSNDASLLLPTSAIGRRYSVVGWPQTIADGTTPEDDFSSNQEDEDLRAFLTIVGTQPNTRVQIQMGPDVNHVMGAGPIPEMFNLDTFEITIGPFDVINLETQGLNADFTGTYVEGDQDLIVFTGSEASDVPRFDSYQFRLCCADHLEEQLFADETLGSRFVVARMPPRTTAINQAFLDSGNSVPEINEIEWVRIVATASGETHVFSTKRTSAGTPFEITLQQRQSSLIRADQDFELWTENGKPLSVLQALPSQEAVGLQYQEGVRLPGGDPALILSPPLDQWRKDYVFLTPDKYAFDFVIIMAERGTNILFDGEPLDPLLCTTSPADGIERGPGDPPPDRVIHRCQLGFPDIEGTWPHVEVRDGLQLDGVHHVVADQPVGLLVYGFDSFVSYGYAGGLNLKEIVR